MAILPKNGSSESRPGCGSTPVYRHAEACRHLAKADPIMRDLIDRIGVCTLCPRRHAFMTLCESITSQQLSPAAADTIFDRFARLYPRRRPSPALVLDTPTVLLRQAGLSSQKIRYVKALADGILNESIRTDRFRGQSNEEIIASLTSVMGIGRWTADMFLIFSLNRPDVLPVDDLGIKKAIQRHYRLPALPDSDAIRTVGRRWHPYASIACWYLWRSLRLRLDSARP